MTEPSPAPETPKRFDARMRAALWGVVGSGLVLTIGGGAIWGIRTGASVAVGAAIAAANLYALARIVGALLPKDGEKAEGGKGRWGAIAFLKLLALFGAVFALIALHVVDALPLMVGFGALPIGIAIGSLVSDRSAAA